MRLLKLNKANTYLAAQLNAVSMAPDQKINTNPPFFPVANRAKSSGQVRGSGKMLIAILFVLSRNQARDKPVEGLKRHRLF